MLVSSNFGWIKLDRFTREISKISKTVHGKLIAVFTYKYVITIRKDIFACLFSVHNIITLLRHERVKHYMINLLYYVISTSNQMFGRAIWDKLPKCIFENFQNSKFSKIASGDLSPKLPEPNMWLLVNHAKPTNTLFWN